MARIGEERNGGHAPAPTQDSAGDPGPSQEDDHISIVIHSDPDTPPVPSCFQTAATLQSPQHSEPSRTNWTSGQPSMDHQGVQKDVGQTQTVQAQHTPTPRGILAQYRRHPDSEIVPDGVTPDMIAAVQQERQQQQEAEQTPPSVPRLDLSFLSQTLESPQRQESRQSGERSGFYIYRGAKGEIVKIPILDLSVAHGAAGSESGRLPVSPPRNHYFHRGAKGDIVKIPTLDLPVQIA